MLQEDFGTLMNLKITLKDPKYCDGCPCEGYIKDGGNEWFECNYYFCELKLKPRTKYKTIRPQKCIEENGE